MEFPVIDYEEWGRLGQYINWRMANYSTCTKGRDSPSL